MPATPPRPTRQPALPFWLAALLAACIAVLAPGTALASGTPNISLAVDAQDTVLYGAQSTVKLTTSNPAGPAIPGFNLSYRSVLPSAVSYVAGSAPALAGEPLQIANQPLAGQTTLVWANVADLPAGTSHSLTFKVAHTAASFGAGGTFTVRGDAYIQDDPNYVPGFTPAGLSDTGGAHPRTGFAENVTDQTKLGALSITTTGDSAPESELLRGVHANQATYDITVKNTTVGATTRVFIDEYLPAGMEFLGCGGAGTDHTTNAPTNSGSSQEYPGSGAITVAALSSCQAPTVVQTSTFDPPGPGPSGIYTHVRWSIATMAAGATATVRYKAAIPLRSNAATWPGATPSISTGAQAANLDNNSGPEIADEAALTSYPSATGDYNDITTFTTDTSLRRFAEDLALRKAPRSSALAQGTTVLWDLDLLTSEYRDASNVTVTDTLPDGLCPLLSGATLTAGAPTATDTAECASAGPTPTAPYKTATENADGTWGLTWDASTDPPLAQIAPNSTHRITFPTAARSHYQEAFEDALPILAGDSVTNAASAAATARVACAGGVACPTGGPTTEIAHDGALAAAVADASSAAITAGTPTLDKRVASTSGDCSAAAYTDGSPAPAYRPGDRICWLLRLDFPVQLDTAYQPITDYLPAALRFDTAFGTSGDQATGNDTFGPLAPDATTAIPGPGGELRWDIPNLAASQAQVFEHRIGTRVELPAGAAPGNTWTNVLKSSSVNSAGVSTPLRDSTDFKLSMPVMSTQKRVVALNGVSQAAVPTQVVRGGDIVTYRVRLSNASADTPAEQVEAWDRLPAGVTCADVAASAVAISTAGVCDNDIIKWGAAPLIGPTVSSASNVDLTYAIRVPTTTHPAQALTGTAGIRALQTTTNTGGAFVYVPSSNIDPAQEPSANVAAASSSATLTGAIPTIAKSFTTSITESNGGISYNAINEATIGETITYTVSATIPAGITVDDFDIEDVIDGRHTYVPASLTQTAGPAADSLQITGGTAIDLSLGTTYTAPTGATDTTFTFTFDAVVDDETTNFRQGLSMVNQASMLYLPPDGIAPRVQTLSNITTAAIVEPVLTVATSVDVGSAPVIGGQIVEYTINLGAQNGITNPAHETTLVDTVAVGLTPLNAAGNPISDGESTAVSGGGVWNLAARTLTFSPSATIFPGATETFKFKASVDIPPIAGTTLTTSAYATTTNRAGTPAVERSMTSSRTVGYSAGASVTLAVQTASVSVAADRTTLTPGEQATYTLSVSIPANTNFYDVFVSNALPPEMEFDSHVSQICTVGCPTAPVTPTVQTYTPVLTGGNIQTVAWDLGDLDQYSAVTRTVQLVFKAHLRTIRRGVGTAVIRPNQTTNAVRVSSNRTDRVGAFNAATIPAPSGGFNDISAQSTVALTTVEPVMGIDKTIAVNAGAYGNGPVFAHDGDLLRYRVVVRNTGDSPAYDIDVNDTPNAELRNVALAANGAATVTDSWGAPGDDIDWNIPGPIAAGATVTLDYTADLPDVTAMKDGDAFVNTASIQHAYGVALAARTTRPGPQFLYRDYSVATIPALSDATTAVYDAPTLVIDKTTGSGAGPTYPDNAGAQVAVPFSWRIRVTNSSATETAKNVTVTDTLPRDWDYVAGSSNFTVGGSANPTITADPSGDQLVWATTATLAPGASTILTYTAKPTLASATSIGTGMTVGARHINAATATVVNGVLHAADENGTFRSLTDTAYATLSVPIIGVTHTPDGGSAFAGSTVPFHIVVANTGPVAATNVIVSDTLPAGSTYAASAATAAPSAGGITFTELSAGATPSWKIASLSPGVSVNITVPIKTDPAAAVPVTITNGASVLSDQTLPVVDDATVGLTGSANLQASKTAPAAATAGAALQYAIGATNLGPSVARDVVLTDVLPATVQFVSASAGCVDTPSGTTTQVICTFPGATAVGGSVTATINTTVKPGITTDANNSVSVASATSDPVAANDVATANVDVGEIADLSIEKTITGASPDPGQATVLRGSRVEFALRVKNTGPSDAPSVQVVDTLPAGLTYVSNDGGCTYAAGPRTVTCSVSGGLPVFDPGNPTGPGAPKTIKVVTDAAVVGVQVNSGAVSGPLTAEPTPADNTDTATVTVVPSVELSLAMSAPPTVVAGGSMTYDLVVSNAGPDASTGSTITQTLPAGVVFDSADPGCTFAPPATVTCTAGAIAAGATATKHVRVRVPASLGAQALTSNASVAGAEADPAPSNQAASATTQVGPSADVSVIQDGPTAVIAGGTLTFTLTVRNDGPSDATSVVVTDRLPAGVTLRSMMSALGSCTEAGGVITCNLGTLPAGASTLLSFTVDVPASMAGTTISNDASASSSVPDPDPSNAASVRATALQSPAVDPPPAPAPADPGPTVTAPPVDPPKVAGTADLAITKTAEGVARAGRELSYTITATNKGPATAEDVVVTDALAAGVEYKVARAGSGKCGYEDGRIRCKVGAISNGESVNVRVIVVPSKTGMLVNNAVLSGTTSDLDQSNNRAVAQNTVSPLPKTTLSLKKTASASRLRGGQRVTYTLKVRNTGKVAAVNVEACDRLPVGMAFTSTKGATLKGSRLCFGKASLAPGKTATFQVRVRLSARARKGKIVNRASADADNAAQQNASATSTVVTDGKVSEGQVRGFTG